MPYIRIEEFSLDEVLPYVRLAELIKDLRKSGVPIAKKKGYRFTEREFCGHPVKLTSHRLRLFAEKGTQCVDCGLQGTFFAMERSVNNQVHNKWLRACREGKQAEFFEWERERLIRHGAKRAENPDYHPPYHFNLYGINNSGYEVMMTKDHIIPKARGGEDRMDNYQPMCQHCNVKKADRIPQRLRRAS